MKITALKNKKAFTLIELVVVIAIIGVLAAVLITVIDPLDKINSASDSGVISSNAQIGRAMDNFAAVNSNAYANVASDLVTNGELKSVPTAPTGYTYYFGTSNSKTSNAACTTAAKDCASYYTASTLLSKKYTGKYYFYRDGQGCVKTMSAPTNATVFASPGITCP